MVAQVYAERRSSLAGSSHQGQPRWNKLHRLLPVQCSEKFGANCGEHRTIDYKPGRLAGGL